MITEFIDLLNDVQKDKLIECLSDIEDYIEESRPVEEKGFFNAAYTRVNRYTGASLQRRFMHYGNILEVGDVMTKGSLEISLANLIMKSFGQKGWTHDGVYVKVNIDDWDADSLDFTAFMLVWEPRDEKGFRLNNVRYVAPAFSLWLNGRKYWEMSVNDADDSLFLRGILNGDNYEDIMDNVIIPAKFIDRMDSYGSLLMHDEAMYLLAELEKKPAGSWLRLRYFPFSDDEKTKYVTRFKDKGWTRVII